jgi:glycosyltransferase involved in cell wall biosynthesis
MPKAYAAADCLALPSDFGETWGLVVNEAMACGLPAIVSDRVGCATDLVEDGVTGRVFRFGDVPALADAIASSAGAPERLAMMGAEARERIAGYSVEAAVAATLDAVRHVARGAD